jgi:RHS repeat-associated protein
LGDAVNQTRGRPDIVFTYVGSSRTATVFLDGVSVGSQVLGSNLSTVANATFNVGSSLGGVLWSGSLDETAVYAAALSAGQVSAHFAASGDTTPAAPTNVAATAGTNKATVTWTASSGATVPTGQTAVTGYEVRAFAGATQFAAIDASASSTSAVVTGLPSGTAYTFTVTGRNEYGLGAASSPSSAVTPSGVTPTYASTIRADSPAVYYRVGEASGSTAADSSGNNRTGTYASGSTLGSSGALANDADTGFSGQASYPGGSGLPTGNADRSLETWFKTTSSTKMAVAGWGTVGGNTDTYFEITLESPTQIGIQTGGGGRPDLPGSASTTYTYNGDGLRMSKTLNGNTTQYTWNTAGQLPLLLVDGTINYVYGPGGLPLEQINADGSTYWFHHDQLGSTRLLTDTNGNTAATYTYDTYGMLTGKTGTANTPLAYAGQYADAETGFQYLRARYYDPATGLFLTRDPADASTRSAYAYSDGSPLNEADPTGLGCGITDLDGCAKEGVSTVASGVADAWNATGGKVVHKIATADYYGACLSGGFIVGAQLCVDVTRDGSVYLTPGIGLTTPGISGNVHIGQVHGGHATSCQVNHYLHGWELQGSLTAGTYSSGVWGNEGHLGAGDYGYEAGVGWAPGLSLMQGYGFKVGDL